MSIEHLWRGLMPMSRLSARWHGDSGRAFGFRPDGQEKDMS